MHAYRLGCGGGNLVILFFIFLRTLNLQTLFTFFKQNNKYIYRSLITNVSSNIRPLVFKPPKFMNFLISNSSSEISFKSLFSTGYVFDFSKFDLAADVLIVLRIDCLNMSKKIRFGGKNWARIPQTNCNILIMFKV